MKKIDIAKAVGLADEKYIAEAAPKANTKGRFWRKFALIAACVSLVVTSVSLWLFLPYEKADEGAGALDKNNLPSALRAYENSEYLDLMYAFYKYDKAHASRPKNNFENYVEDFLDDLLDAFMPKMGSAADGDRMPNASAPTYGDGFNFSINEAADSVNKGDGGEYVETTDNQVAGVIEADLFKRTTSHIFYLDLNNAVIRVYSIAGEESCLVSTYNIKSDDERGFLSYSTQMFLSQDGKTLTLVGNKSDIITYDVETKKEKYLSAASIISLDVSDPENIKENSRFAITGNFITARFVDGKILLMTQFNTYGFDYSDMSAFVPQIDTGDGFKPIPAEDIIFPEELTSKYYTVVTQLDGETLALEGAAACLGYSTEIYVSADKLFLTRSYNDYFYGEDDGVRIVRNVPVTEILALGYGNGSFENLGQITVEGSIKNQYSLDEYEGILRVVTTTRGTKYSGGEVKINGSYVVELTDSVSTVSVPSNAALYCIDLSTWQIVGEVKDFAPAGETVESVRFDGTNAYVCTAVVITLTDPVYFFDLSDMSNITYTDTGVIEGYSSSLVNFGDGILLGIGYGDDLNTLKIEVYAENGDKVESLCSYERKKVLFAEEYKSYFIDRERGLIGLAISDRTKRENMCEYILLAFNGYELVEAEQVGFENYIDLSNVRATLIDDYFYIMGYDNFEVVKIFN